MSIGFGGGGESDWFAIVRTVIGSQLRAGMTRPPKEFVKYAVAIADELMEVYKERGWDE